eukprot:m51a1_g8358 hypothetical protein (886) ;mRNA; f:76191-79420
MDHAGGADRPAVAVEHHPLEHPPAGPPPRPPSVVVAATPPVQSWRRSSKRSARPLTPSVTRREQQELTELFGGAVRDDWEAPSSLSQSYVPRSVEGSVRRDQRLFDDVDVTQESSEFLADLRKSRVSSHRPSASCSTASLAVSAAPQPAPAPVLVVAGRKRRNTAGRLNLDAEMTRRLNETLASHGKTSKADQIVKKSAQLAAHTDKLAGELAEGSPVCLNLEFAKLLDMPDCKDLKQTVESFVKTFEKQTKGVEKEEERVLKTFLAVVEKAMRTRSIWARLPAKHFVIAREEMHKYIYQRLYPILFTKKEMVQQDAELRAHIAKIRPYVTAQFLEIDQVYYEHESVSVAVHELETLDTYVSPLEKLTCIYNSCRILIYILSNEGSAAGADDFLPLLILALLRADMPSLASNFNYVARFVEQEDKYGEGYCYYTHLYSAAMYLRSLTPEMIAAPPPPSPSPSSSPQGAAQAARPPQPQELQFQMDPEAPQPAQPAQPAAEPLPADDEQFVASLRFLDASPDALRPQDLPGLLAEYRRLAAMARAFHPLAERRCGEGDDSARLRVCSAPLPLPQLPGGDSSAPEAMSMALANGCAWVGMSDGAVLVVGVPSCAPVCSLRAFDGVGVCALAVSRGLLWAAAAGRNQLSVVDLASSSVACSVAPLAPPAPSLRCIASAPACADACVWVAGPASPQSPSTASAVAALRPDGVARCAAVVPYAVAALVPHGAAVWAACDTGHVVALAPESAAVMMSVLPFGPPSAGVAPRAVRLASSGPALWAASGAQVVAVDCARGAKGDAVDAPGGSGEVSALCGLPAGEWGALFAVVRAGGSVCVCAAGGGSVAEGRSVGVELQHVCALPVPAPSGAVTWAAVADGRLVAWTYTARQ